VSDVISVPENILKAIPVILKLRMKHYDLVIDGFPSTKNTALLSFLIGSGKNIGYVSKTLKNKYIFLYKKSIFSDGRYVVGIDSDILKLLGITIDKKDMVLEIPGNLTEYEKMTKEIVGTHGFVVGVHIGKDLLGRRWLYESWADVLNYVQEKYHAKIIIIGGDQDIENTEKVIALMEKKPLNLVNKISLNETWALMKKFDLFLCVNGGPVHMASVLKKPTICITICTWFEWDPYNENAVVIRSEKCKEPGKAPNCGRVSKNCEEDIDTRTVKKEIDNLYRKYVKK
jgi:ADP-heptose:LPS heptosyltransferase